MTLCDTGPLVALIDSSERENRDKCMAVLPLLRGPLITTWPCLTEVMYFLGERGGFTFQKALWKYVESGKLALYTHGEAHGARMHEPMERYRDIPMDLPDASLVVLAESLDITRVFTLDQHFRAYRVNGRHPFDVYPTGY